MRYREAGNDDVARRVPEPPMRKFPRNVGRTTGRLIRKARGQIQHRPALVMRRPFLEGARMVEERRDGRFDGAGGIGRARRVASETTWRDAKRQRAPVVEEAHLDCAPGSGGGTVAISRGSAALARAWRRAAPPKCAGTGPGRNAEEPGCTAQEEEDHQAHLDCAPGMTEAPARNLARFPAALAAFSRGNVNVGVVWHFQFTFVVHKSTRPGNIISSTFVPVPRLWTKEKKSRDELATFEPGQDFEI